MKTSELRSRFLNYFAAQSHKVVASSSVVGPADDPTVMWTNAGMVQFKDIFVGKEKRDYARAATSQKCLRAGGKHNDLENVGFTARHHTFFEMLGNFSFGDYFKADAIRYAWEFVTGPVEKGNLGLDPDRLWITVFEGKEGVPADTEAEELWKAVGVRPDRILRFGKDNFWQMGDTGPCGPCSEMHYYRPQDLSGNCAELVNGEGDETMEIWNLVFMQYEQDGKGGMKPLPKPSIDTGMGLERVASILQGKETNYEIDLFEPIFEAIWKVAKVKHEQRAEHANRTASQVVADHIRASVFMIFDGVVPSNEGRGYVLRKIIRRALRFGKKLGIEGRFFADLAPTVLKAMGDAYPELEGELPRIQKVIAREEGQFSVTLNAGLKLLEGISLSANLRSESKAKAKANLSSSISPRGELIFGLQMQCDLGSGAASSREPEKQILSGSDIFKLYDTYGFPVDLVKDWCKERGVEPDLEGFQKELSEQKAKSRASMQTHDVRLQGDYSEIPWRPNTEFLGYERLDARAAVLAMFDANKKKVEVLVGSGFVLLDKTPFYAASGGQVGDTGTLQFESGSARVMDVTTPAPKHSLHQVEVIGQLKQGATVHAQVDASRRARIQAHHTATHLLHAALREVLGTHVKQAGSSVDAERLRFDFSHFAPIEPEQMAEVERLVNEQTLKAQATSVKSMSIDEALQCGAMALFGEKYGETVRVVSVPGFSLELCGGTHAANTGEIGAVKVVSEGAVAAGVRRIEAVAGMAAVELLQQSECLIQALSRACNTSRDSLCGVLSAKDARIAQLEKELKEAKLKAAQGGGSSEKVEEIKGITVVTAAVEGLEGNALREMMDQVRTRHRSAVVVLASTVEGKVSILVSVSADLQDRADAGALLKLMAPHVDGRGGGKKDLAQGGGTKPEGVNAAMEALKGAL